MKKKHKNEQQILPYGLFKRHVEEDFSKSLVKKYKKPYMSFSKPIVYSSCI